MGRLSQLVHLPFIFCCRQIILGVMLQKETLTWGDVFYHQCQGYIAGCILSQLFPASATCATFGFSYFQNSLFICSVILVWIEFTCRFSSSNFFFESRGCDFWKKNGQALDLFELLKYAIPMVQHAILVLKTG